jgi:hypothetical protein
MNTIMKRIENERPSVSFRFFRIDGGPVMDAAKACDEKRIAARDAWRDFLRNNGGNPDKGYQNGRLIGFGSRTPPAGDAWKRDFSAEDLWVPNRKTKAGRALAEAMKKLPAAPSYHGAFEDFGLYDCPIICDGKRWFRPVMFGVIGKTIWLKIAWKDYAPDLIAEYVAQRDNRDGDYCRSEEIDFIADWKPAEGMVEVKEWEALRDSEALFAEKKEAA